MRVTLSVKGLTSVLVLFPCALTSSCPRFSTMLFVSFPCVLRRSFLFECFQTFKSVFGWYNLMDEELQVLLMT